MEGVRVMWFWIGVPVVAFSATVWVCMEHDSYNTRRAVCVGALCAVVALVACFAGYIKTGVEIKNSGYAMDWTSDRIIIGYPAPTGTPGPATATPAWIIPPATEVTQ